VPLCVTYDLEGDKITRRRIHLQASVLMQHLRYSKRRNIMHKQICHPKPGINPAGFSRFPSFLLVIALIAGMAISLKPAGVVHAEGPNAILNLAGCTTNSLARNDDGSTASIGLPFTLNFYGTDYGALFVNNNGNVTFDTSLGTYTPFNLSTNLKTIIAPFFADVDTRGTGSGLVTYGATTYDGRSAFCVNWVNVGYYGSHYDKLNSIQLLLVERFDTGSGNFDMMFNYDKVQWETGDASSGSGGLGGYSARAGYSDGLSNFFELPGSAVNGGLLDSNASTGLINNSLNSSQLGRYIFQVRNGVYPPGGTISGTVYQYSVAPANVLAGAFVQVCAGDACRTARTNANGAYIVRSLPDGAYFATAFPPGGSTLLPSTIGALTISGGNTLAGQDIVLTGPTPLPDDTTIEPSTPGGGGPPVVFWGNPLVLRKIGCSGGVANYQITQGTTVIRSGSMAEAPAGTYTANVAAFWPLHGNAHVSITLVCPGGGTDPSEGDIYIDPSGVVKTTGGDLLPGATVTLFHSDSASGPFDQVPNGSGIMNASNRDNPDLTDATGNFGWDVIAGYYKVRAEKTGCVSPANSAIAYVETSVMQIPPPVTDLVLVLNCGNNSIYMPLIIR
jgi:hypothetical protein